MAKLSAGLLMFRRTNKELEVFLVHPGGPYYAKRDDAIWGVPKGEVANQAGNDAEIFNDARREFEEEIGFAAPEDLSKYIDLGSVTQKSGKVVRAWAFELDFQGQIKSNTTKIEWPPKSGKMLEIPEVDRGEFFTLAQAEPKIISAQYELLLRLKQALKL